MSANILIRIQDELEKITSEEPVRAFSVTLVAGLIICFIGISCSMNSKLAGNEGRLESLSSELKPVKEHIKAMDKKAAKLLYIKDSINKRKKT